MLRRMEARLSFADASEEPMCDVVVAAVGGSGDMASLNHLPTEDERVRDKSEPEGRSWW